MTSALVWVLRHLLCTCCVPSYPNKHHSPCARQSSRTLKCTHWLNLYNHPGRCAHGYPAGRKRKLRHER